MFDLVMQSDSFISLDSGLRTYIGRFESEAACWNAMKQYPYHCFWIFPAAITYERLE